MGIAGLLGGAASTLRLSGSTDLQQDQGLILVMTVASVVGAVLTWAFLAYALWKYRDPATRGRRYG